MRNKVEAIMKNSKLKTKIVLMVPLVSSLFLALSAHAKSSGGGIVGSPNDRLIESDTQCASCPTTPQPGATIGFEALEEVFAKSQTPTESALRGDWKLTLKVSRPELVDGATFPPWFPDGASPEGFKRRGGQYWRSLHFALPDSSWGEEVKPTVSLMGLTNNANPLGQGPYFVTFRDQSACFAQYGYSYSVFVHAPISGLKSTSLGFVSYFAPYPMRSAADVTFSYSCRRPPGREDRLLCAVTPHGDGFAVEQQPWLDRVIEYVGYERIK
jgi:hypothetical protein